VEVTVINRQTKVDWDPGLEIKVIQALQRTGQIHGLPPETEVSLVLVDEEEIRSFNREYRGVDRPTDVLSFALNEGTSDEPGYEAPEEMEPVLGDIIISLETAEDQGRDYGHGLAREVAYLAVHGMLHLLGYDHQDEEARTEMRLMEERVLKDVGLDRL